MDFRKIEMFCAGRDGRQGPHNEDIAVAYSTPRGPVLAVIDGVTATTGWTQRDAYGRANVTSGWLAGQAVDQAIRQILTRVSDLCSHMHFLEFVFGEWMRIRSSSGFPAHELVGVAYAIYVPWANNGHGEIWTLADCVYRYEMANGNHLSGGPSPGHSRDALLRKKAIEELMAGRRKLSDAELAKAGRAGMAQARATLVKTNGTWLDSLDRVKRRAKAIALPEGVTKLVLATDGFIVPPGSIEEGLANLARWRERDPLCIGRNGGLCTPKGFVDETTGEVLPFTDDVGILVATM